MRRWLLLGLPGALLLGGVAVWGYLAFTTWKEGQPETIYAAARQAFKQGEDALKRDDTVAALKAFQTADTRLQVLLAADKAPKHPQGLVLRYHTLLQLAALASRPDRAAGVSISSRRSNEIFADARRCAELAAADPANFEAQAAMLDACFRQDQFEQSERYARNLLDHLPEKPSGELDLHPYIMGAHFVLARAALEQSPPVPDEVLRRARTSDEEQKRWVQTKFAGSADAPDVRTRWRMIYLEAQALQLRARDGVASESEELQTRFNAWLDRLRNDLKPATSGAMKGQVPLAVLSGRDLRAMLDFLSLAVEWSPDRASALDRLLVNLAVWEALTSAPKTAAHKNAATEAAERYLYWPQLVEKVPVENRPQAEEWATLSARLVATGGKLVEAGVPFDPIVFTGWARQAQKFGQLDAGARLAQLGLKSAAALRFSPDDPRVLDLHVAAAWLCLLQKKPDEMEEHLIALRKVSGNQSGWTRLIDGLSALDEGLLEKGLSELTLAAKHPELGPSLSVQIGLAYANSALGRYDLAVPHLSAVERYYGKSDSLPEQSQTLANRFSLTRSGMLLELFRCHLGLGHMDLALQYRELLHGEPEWVTASVTLVRHRLGVGPTAAVRTTLAPRTPTAEWLALARAELTELRRAAPRDARVLLLEAEWMTVEMAASPESAQARADNFLRAALVNWQGDADDAQFVWATWLTSRGRTDEAAAILDRLEKVKSGPLPRRVALLRNHWQLIRSRTFVEADRLLGVLGLGGDPLGLDPYLVGWDVALSRHESTGLGYFWRGQAAHARGEFEVAANAYGRALSFAPFRAAARRHLLACLLRLRDKDASAVANAVVSDLLQSSSVTDPVLLVAFIETALPLDKITGKYGVQQALDVLAGVLSSQVVDGAAVPAYRAQTWLAAGRPDLAKTALEQALRANRAHLPSLFLAGEVARANEDWQTCLKQAAALEKVRPEQIEAAVWKADALTHLGDLAAAESAYRDLADGHPDRPDGYRGLVSLREKAKDYPTALAQIKRWQTRLPTDSAALQAEVRLLCRSGRAAAADDVGAQAVQRAAARAPEVTLAVARGFLEASASEPALAWAKKAEAAAAAAPDRETLLQARCLKGDACRALAARTEDAGKRRDYLDQAIDHYRAAFKDSPGYPAAGQPLALLLAVERGEAEAAFAIVQRLRQGRSNEALRSGDRLPLDLLDVLGTVYLATRHDNEAVLLFREASRRYTREPLVFLHLGRAYAALGQVAEATTNLNLAAQLASERAERAFEPEEKTRWLELARAARLAEKQLNRR